MVAKKEATPARGKLSRRGEQDEQGPQADAAIDWVTSAIHVPRDVLVLLRRVAVERANRNGGRPSVSAVLVDLVRANAGKLEREASR